MRVQKQWWDAVTGVPYGGFPVSAQKMRDLGYMDVPPVIPEPVVTEEWVSKEAFVGALSALVDADTLAASLADTAKLKTGLTGLALLTTDAAPGGMINLLDSRVEPWLETFGLTLEQVRTEML